MRPIVIRNARVVAALYLVLGVAAFFIGGCAALLVIHEWFLQKLSFFSILGGAQWGVAAWCFWLMGVRMFRLGMRTGKADS